MTQYKVTLTTFNGDTTYLVKGESSQQVAVQVEQTLKARTDVKQYTVEPAVQAVTPDAMRSLYQASGGLVACIVILILAEFQIRKWLNS